MTCVHVYQMVGADLCPHCGLTTHETNWAETNEKHRAWKEYIIDNPQELTWWSI
jgi:predicted Fe-S protein YdhL (DUF1289 family)